MKISVDADKVIRLMQAELGALIKDCCIMRARAETAEAELDVLRQLQAKAAAAKPEGQEP